jgi:hypothetical protein
MGLLISTREPLFQPRSLAKLLADQKGKAETWIEHFSDDDILTKPIEDMVDAIYEGTYLQSLVIDRKGVSQIPRHVTLHPNPFGRPQQVDAYVYEVEFPYTGATGLFRHTPASRDLDPPKARLDQGAYKGTVIISVLGEDLSPEIIKAEIDKELAKFDRYIAFQELEIEPFNSTLKQYIRDQITARKEKVLKARSVAASLGYPMRRREGAPETYITPVVRRRFNVAPAQTGSFAPEPTIDEAEYQHILSIIQNMTLVMERSPSVFSKMPEETLRDHYLVQLNGQYESATGETFNAEGKTDILVKDGSRNVFIAECKIWYGPKTVTDALGQLLSYLTWRDTKAALLVFSRNKDFTNVLSSLWETVEAHPQMKRGPTAEGETRMRYIYARPDDANREIILTVMAIPMPSD